MTTLADNRTLVDVLLARPDGTPAYGSGDPTTSLGVSLPADVTVSGPAGLSAANTDLLTGTVSGWYDAGAFHSGALQIIASAGISAGAITVEQTNDTVNAAAGVSVPIQDPTSLIGSALFGAQSIAASSLRLFLVPIIARYIRIRISTAFVGGTVRAVATFSQLPFASPSTSSSATPATSFPLSLNSAATTNATSAKTSAGNLFSLSISNISATPRYFKMYNKASAPTVGTDIPVIVIPVAAGSTVIAEFGPLGMRFSLGIAYAITGLITDADTTAIGAGEVKLMVAYN